MLEMSLSSFMSSSQCTTFRNRVAVLDFSFLQPCDTALQCTWWMTLLHHALNSLAALTVSRTNLLLHMQMHYYSIRIAHAASWLISCCAVLNQGSPNTSHWVSSPKLMFRGKGYDLYAFKRVTLPSILSTILPKQHLEGSELQ